MSEGLLNAVNPDGKPGIYCAGANKNEGDIAVKEGGALQVGHWDPVAKVFCERMNIKSDGRITTPKGELTPSKFLQLVDVSPFVREITACVLDTVVTTANGDKANHIQVSLTVQIDETSLSANTLLATIPSACKMPGTQVTIGDCVVSTSGDIRLAHELTYGKMVNLQYTYTM